MKLVSFQSLNIKGAALQGPFVGIACAARWSLQRFTKSGHEMRFSHFSFPPRASGFVVVWINSADNCHIMFQTCQIPLFPQSGDISCFFFSIATFTRRPTTEKKTSCSKNFVAVRSMYWRKKFYSVCCRYILKNIFPGGLEREPHKTLLSCFYFNVIL